jgi:tetratricopeptide (TPR) repeat protein
MLDDSYGNKISTSSVDAIESYNQGVHQFLGAEPGVEVSFKAAISADPEFTLAYIGLAREMQLRGRSGDLKQSLDKAFETDQNLSAREQSHLSVSSLLLRGKSAEARVAVYEHVKEWPRDVLIAQMCSSVFGLIGFSGLPGREAEQLSFMTNLVSNYGDDWWCRAQLAFAQLEVGQLDEAGINIEEALLSNPNSAHSKHIRAHLYYENLQDEDGLRYLQRHWENYDPSGALYNHISWHVGLWSLETGNLEQMWSVLDKHISPDNNQGPPLNVLTDMAALLFRAELAGVEVNSKRWRDLSAYAITKFANPGLGFADFHAAITHARAGNIEALENIIANAKGPVSDLTKKVARAYLYMQDADWLSASELFTSVVREHARFGGSNAQRDLLDFSLAACLIHQGRTREAKTILAITRPRALQKDIISGLH